MFLIEFDEGQFIDGERIGYIQVGEKEIRFTMIGMECTFTVNKNSEEIFVNHMQALNKNVSNIAARLEGIRNPNMEY